MMDELLERCREGCEVARRHGATDVEVVAHFAEEISVTIEKHDLQIARSSHESTFGIRVLVGDRLGFASTNVARDLSVACRDAITLARATPGDPHNRFPDPQCLPAVQDLLDERASEFSAGDAVDCASTMLRVAEAVDRRVIVGDGAFSSLRTGRAVANTRGVAASEAASLFMHHVLVTAKEDERVSSMDFQFGACRHAKDIDVAPAVALACRNAIDSLGSAPGETFQGIVILSPNAVLDVVVAPLLFQINARNVLRGLSRWRDHLGHPVASPTLSIIDDGTRPGGVASSSFDREGVPHAARPLVERGRLVSLLHNTYSSSALGATNTGHAAGSASSLPMIGPTNLTLAPGAASLEELVADTEQGLLVGRFSGNVDPISGDFSGVAKAAHLLRHGRRAYPVTGTLVAGNAFDVLGAILDVSRDTQQIFGFTLPYLRIGGVSITAG
jgi:PmbA protein